MKAHLRIMTIEDRLGLQNDMFALLLSGHINVKEYLVSRNAVSSF